MTALTAANTAARNSGTRTHQPSLLAGMLFDTIGAKPRDFSRADLLLPGDTASPLEETGFETLVPPPEEWAFWMACHNAGPCERECAGRPARSMW